MGKRSDFERNPRDYYPTPYEAVIPLIPHIVAPLRPMNTPANFIEPCAGDGRLIRHLEKHGHKCVYACDIEPQAEGIEKRDIFTAGSGDMFFTGALPPCDLIITNPPWERDTLHKMIELFVDHAPTWLLFDSDWANTTQATPYEDLCKEIVSVGRVSWMGNGVSGMDNCSWYLFAKGAPRGTRFHFRR